MAKKYFSEDDINGFSIAFEVTAPVGFTEITDQEQLKQLHMKRYVQLEKDGRDFYNGFRTKLYLEILNGNQTPSEAFVVETHLKTLGDNLNTGNWLTAQYENSTLSLVGAYDQALKDEVQTGIDAYILQNY